jgi:hypothetical protein
LINRGNQGLYEPLLQDNEREAVADLLQFLESKSIQRVDNVCPIAKLPV